MKYLKKLDNISDYNAIKKVITSPSISYVEDIDKVMWKDETYYNDKYLTTIALSDGTISFTMYAALTVANCTRISYSTDNGETWTTFNNAASTVVTVSVNVTAGQEILWKGSALRFNTSTSGTSQNSMFSSTCNFNVIGNVMSLLYEDNFIDKKTFPNTSNGVFGGLFQGCTGLINAENLLLPATTLVPYCYIAMFRNCTSLIAAPKLPAMSLANSSYPNMFEGCTSLVNAPELPATTIPNNYGYSAMFSGCTALKYAPKVLPCLNPGNYAYTNMFKGCTSLTQTPDIKATSSGIYVCAGMFYGCTALVGASPLRIVTCGSYYYSEMFRGCTSLKTPPQILATTMGDHSCNYMFYGCTKLLSTPDLSGITTLGTYCFTNMFQNCSSIVNVTELPQTTLKDYCYQSMFYSCTSLTSAPELPATVLADRCYASMFFNCSKLKYIKMMALDLGDAENYRSTLNWVYNVAKSGTFVMNSEAQWYKCGVSGIPDGWNIEYEGDYSDAEDYMDEYLAERAENALKDCFKTTALTSGTITLTIPKGVTASYLLTMSYSIDNGITWVTTTNNSTAKTITVNVTAGDEVLWRGTCGWCGQMSANITANNFSQFTSTCNFSISGKLLSLIDGDLKYDDIDMYDYYGYTFAKLFMNCTGLISAKNLILPSTTCTYCYSNMFDGCINLVDAPALCYAHDIMTGSYQYMFQNCTSLTYAPAIPSIRCYQYSCRYMFAGCTGITHAGPISVIDIQSVSNNYSFDHAFYGCTSLISTPSFAPTTLQHRCCEYMFAGCTALTRVMPILPATGLMNYCYGHMFSNCPNITRAPVLPATAWSNYCYQYMFENCSSLNYIKCMAASAPAANNQTLDWVKGVAAAGTFVRNGTKWTATGTSNIPTGWTIETATPIPNANYFTTEAIDDCVFTLTLPAQLSTTDMSYIEYSVNNSTTWTRVDNINNQQVTITTPTISAGSHVSWRGNGSALGLDGYGSSFSSTGRYNVSGNIMSLINNATTISKNYAFRRLFFNSTNLISAENLKLPSTTLTEYCYNQMFQGCTSLVAAPALPGTILASRCYSNMFVGCTSLVSVPSLPATILKYCCYANMFYECASLVTAPELPATILGDGCYSNMFVRCTSLVNAPALPATTLTKSCYEYMFFGCTSLVNAPALPATTLATRCYQYMFRGCTSLVNAPVLPSTTLVQYCYNYMFYGCSSLNYINAQFLSMPGTDYTNNWVYGVAASGTFVQNLSAVWFVTGVHAIPSGWSIDTEWPDDYFTTVAVDACTFTLSIPPGISTDILMYIEYSTDGGSTWTNVNNVNNQQVTITTPAISAGNNVKWRGNGPYGCTLSKNDNCSHFSSTGRYNITGNIMSLIGYPTLNIGQNLFSELFKDSTNLVNAKDLKLPLMPLTQYCYAYMFQGCTSLITAPELPATILAVYCYRNMFQGCTSLVNAPALPSDSIIGYCYQSMFEGCTSLVNAPALNGTSLASSCYQSMFKNCSSLVNAPVLNCTSLSTSCYQSMFSGCTSLVTAPSLNATSLAQSCYQSMFEGCSSLVDAPPLPATIPTIAQSCYKAMFKNCTSLVNAPIMNSISLSFTCYQHMFNGCTSLINAPTLPATILYDGCYECMFYGCTSLVNAPALPATTLANNCYSNMFYGCTSLVNAPEILPSTELKNGCYLLMFYGCTSLVTAPTLPANSLTTRCYFHMFENCNSLSYIEALFTTSPTGNDYTENWVNNVATNGIFKKAAKATWDVIGVNGVPERWDIDQPEAPQLLMTLWFDDFGGAPEIEDDLDDPQGNDANKYYHCGGYTITYNNNRYYLFEADSNTYDSGAPKYMLLTTDNFSTLRSQSIAVAGYGASFDALVAFLETDYSTIYDADSYKVQETKLVSVGSNFIWVDKFDALPSQDYVDDPDGMGSNKYEYYGNTLEYDNNICHIWDNAEPGNGAPEHILTSTDAYSTLYNQSLEYGFDNGTSVHFDSFVAALNDDMTLRYDTSDENWGATLQLVKVEENRTPLLVLWFDDFPDDGDGSFDGMLVEDMKDNEITNPESSGNKYVYYGDTMEYDGDEYYLWKYYSYNGSDSTINYILTTTVDFNVLQNQSMEYAGYDAEFSALAVKMSLDGTCIYEGVDVATDQLIAVREWED